jgi:hypothetical protein
MPEAMRSDNGAPFASTGIARLTRLGVWLVSLGITRQLIEPARPAQNGRHERMHRTLKECMTRPPAANLPRQQELFTSFQREFNEERPHEALGMKRPAEVYRPSPRPYPETIPPIEYPGHYEVRRVSRNGGVRWRSQWLNVGHALIEQDVGFHEVADGIWDVFFGPRTDAPPRRHTRNALPLWKAWRSPPPNPATRARKRRSSPFPQHDGGYRKINTCYLGA